MFYRTRLGCFCLLLPCVIEQNSRFVECLLDGAVSEYSVFNVSFGALSCGVLI